MIIKVENEKAVIDKLASYIERISNESIESRGKFFIGLSGKFQKLGNIIVPIDVL